MRSMFFATVATFGLTFGAAAMAQTTNADMAPPSGHVPGIGLSEASSTSASNISASDARSPIAPRLPGSAAPSAEMTAGQELRMAQQDLSAKRTGAAQEALERAETRLLDRSTMAGMTNVPDTRATVSTIAQARQALGRHDLSGAQSLISQAMAQTAG